MRTVRRRFALAVVLSAAGLGGHAGHWASASVPFIFDDNRIFATLEFVRQDGSVRQALAYVDIGTPQLVLSKALATELGVTRGNPLALRVGEVRIDVPAKSVATTPGDIGHTGPNGRKTVPVEAILSGSVMQDYAVTIDYDARTLTMVRAGETQSNGTPMPVDVNPITGLVSVKGEIAGRTYDMAIDVGSAYTWFRADTVNAWLAKHPKWLRGLGAVGESNMQTLQAEAHAAMVRVPEIRLGDVRLEEVGALGISPALPPFPPVPGGSQVSGDMFDWYSAKAPHPVIGWIGGNVLKAFTLTIDYPRRTIWWLRRHPPDEDDLDQVGLTLVESGGGYAVSAIAEKDGRPTVQGIEVGDRLVRIDGLEVKSATRGAMFAALHGKPGDVKQITVERRGALVTVPAPVTAF